MPTPPMLTPEARAAALEKAARIRRERADIKRQLKVGSLTLERAFELVPTNEAIAKMKVLALLEALPALGKVKARRVLDQVGISESRRVQGLGANQRAELLKIAVR
ncbi:MAG: integration host factor, actinobacterial type [Actinomycetes bacterium]